MFDLPCNLKGDIIIPEIFGHMTKLRERYHFLQDPTRLLTLRTEHQRPQIFIDPTAFSHHLT